jgi:hypothetical protein
VDRHFAGGLIQPEALGCGYALAIRQYRETLSAIREYAGSTFGRQCEHDRGSSNRLVILILNTNDRLASSPLANIVYSAFTFHDNNIQFGGKGLRVQRRKSD